jgi:folate-binding protein YgfZ
MSAPPANPLHDLHRQAEAEFQFWADVEIVSTFGEPQAEYAAIRKSCALMDLPQRGFLELTGRDRLSFLNGLVTAETWDKQTKRPMPAGRWAYSFILNLKGRIVADMNVLELGERTLIETDVRMVELLAALFEAYHFAEQVKMRNRADLHEIVLHGPGAPALISLVATDASPWVSAQSTQQAKDVSSENHGLASVATTSAPGACAVVKFLGQEAVAWRDDPTGLPGIHLIVSERDARALWMHLVTVFGQTDEAQKRKLRPIGWAAFNSTRIEAGRPIFGIDFDGAPVASAYPSKQQREQATVTEESSPGVLPAETGLLERAVSLSKCYVGQEVVARMHARGQVARKLVGIRMDDDALPIAGAQIFDESSNAVGLITSSTVSPVLSNAAVCLGFVKRPQFEIGTKLRVPAEGAIHAATVVELPFVRP